MFACIAGVPLYLFPLFIFTIMNFKFKPEPWIAYRDLIVHYVKGLPGFAAAKHQTHASAFTMYPNPVKHLLYIDSSKPPLGHYFELNDWKGMAQCAGKLKLQQVIDMLDYPPGIYMVRIFNAKNETLEIRQIAKE